jgi:hypothetical protein
MHGKTNQKGRQQLEDLSIKGECLSGEDIKSSLQCGVDLTGSEQGSVQFGESY